MDGTPLVKSEPTQQQALICIELQADPTVNYGSYQNHVPLVRSLSIANTSNEVLADIEVVIRYEPQSISWKD